MAQALERSSRDHARLRSRRALIGLALLAVLAGLSGIAIGSTPIPLGSVVATLLGHGDPVATAVIVEIRLPRALLGLAIGAMFGMSGAALQGYLRNPLAEPSVLGVSNAAALGAVMALYFGLANSFALALPLMAVFTAVLALVVVVALSRWSDSALTLVLAGIAVGTLAGAAISLALNLSPNPFAAMEITNWLLGSLEDRSLKHVALALPFIALGMALLVWDGHALDALTLGEDTAATLGFDLKAIRLRLVLGIALGVGGAVSVCGSIGFVGLIVPHIMRPLVGSQPSRLLIPSALAGASLLTVSDVLVRIIPATNELKLGVVTSFLGVPFFLLLLFRNRRAW